MQLIVEIVNIVTGLILAMGILPNIPAVGKDLERLAKWLGSFQTVIGIVAIVVGILFFSLLQGTVAIAAGLILSIGILSSIPALGKYLVQLAKWLGSFQTIIGVIAILFGVLGLLRIL